MVCMVAKKLGSPRDYSLMVWGGGGVGLEDPGFGR